MKVLHYSEYISIDNDLEFSKNLTGYGYMVMDIASTLADTGIDVSILTFNGITTGKKIKNVLILNRTWIDIFLNIKVTSVFNVLKTLIQSSFSIREGFRVSFGYISIGYFQKVLYKNNYDLIHIHGISPTNLPIIQYCINKKIKFIVTLHGLNSFSSSIDITNNQYNIERSFLKKAYRESIPVTVISEGIKNQILSFLELEQDDAKNITVVQNGCLIKKDITHKLGIDIREKFGIEKKSKVALCVGNFMKRKNQIQVVRSYAKLPLEEKEKLYILFLGDTRRDKNVEELIQELGLNQNLIVCGVIEKSKIHYYYEQADFTILASVNEGFGLSIIEGFIYGLPNLTFSNLEAIPDIYNKKVMVALDSRTDEALSDGIIEMVSKEWDSNYIKEYSKNFSLESMAKKYLTLYEKVLHEK